MRSLLYILIIALGISACETVVEVDIPIENPKIVVNAFIQPSSAVSVYLSKSKSVLSNARLSGVSGATITLLENGQSVAVLEEIKIEDTYDPYGPRYDEQQTLYISDFQPSIANEYTIQIDKAGFDPVEATTFIGPPVPIQDIQYDTTVNEYSYYDGDSLITEKQINLSEVRLSIADPGGESNYYEIMVEQYTTQYIIEYNPEDESYIITDTITYLAPVYLTSDDPVVNEGDFFSGDDRYYGSSLLFPDEIFNGKTYTVRFNVESYSYSQEPVKEYIISLRSLSEAQYFYLRSTDLQNETEGNPFAEPVPVYNNIENGYGIFAGFSSDKVRIMLE